jgi:glycine cleavage system H protein
MHKGGETMKELSAVILPDDVRYTKDHEWAKKLDSGTLRIGISDYAQDQLGDIVFVELPQIGDAFEKGAEFATVESVKAVSEGYMPVNGEVAAVNTELDDAPELINAEPYEAGWMIEIAPRNPAEFDKLMDKAAYLDMLQGEAS